MWARLLSAALGAWLMAAPGVLGYGGPAGVGDHVVGPIVVASAIVAAWPVMRPLRWVGLVAGVWLLAAPFVLGYAAAPRINDLVAGILLALLSFMGGRTEKSFGGGWSSLLERTGR